MFLKGYSVIVTVAAVAMYAHIRHVEGWIAGMRAVLTAQSDETETMDKTEESSDENN